MSPESCVRGVVTADVLIHAEAGGFSRLRGSGAAFRPDAAIIEAPLLLAADEGAWQGLNDLVS